jgi:hypothetical protein
MSDAHVTMIGSFPPPIGGAAMSNAMVYDALVAAGVNVTRIDVAGPRLSHSRSLAYHARRSARNLLGLRRPRVTQRSTSFPMPGTALGTRAPTWPAPRGATAP